MTNRIELIKEIKSKLDFISLLGDSWKRDFATNILNQGWISERQLHHLNKCYYDKKRAMTKGSSYDIDCHASGSWAGYASHPGQFDGR